MFATHSDESSDDEFIPPPSGVRVEAALTELEASNKTIDVSGWWVIQQLPSPMKTTRISIHLSRDGTGFHGTGEVAMMKDSSVIYLVEFSMKHIYGPAYSISQRLITKSHLGNAHLRPKTWIGTSTVYVDNTGSYFSGTYLSGYTAGVITAARTTESYKIQTDTKWPPRPPPKKKTEQTDIV